MWSSPACPSLKLKDPLLNKDRGNKGCKSKFGERKLQNSGEASKSFVDCLLCQKMLKCPDLTRPLYDLPKTQHNISVLSYHNYRSTAHVDVHVDFTKPLLYTPSRI